jgi:O-antigen ligase
VTTTAATLARPIARPSAVATARLDLLDTVFLVSAAVAPLELRVVANLTVYDLLTLGLALLIVAGPRRLAPLPRVLLPAAVLFLAAAVLSSFRSVYPIQSLTQVAQFAFIFLIQIPVVMTMARDPRVLRLAIGMFLLGSLAGAVAAMVFTQVAGADRVLAFYSDNPNRLGYPTAYLAPVMLWFVQERWRSGRRASAIGIAAVSGYPMLWALTASASRGATVGLLVSLPLYLVFRHGFRVTGRTIAGLIVTTAVIGGLAYALFQTALFPVTLKERIEATFAGEQSLINDRERLAEAAWRSFERSPFVGTGLDNFRYVAGVYEAASTDQAPHNLWLQFLAQVGLMGTVAFAYLTLGWFRAMIAAFTRAREDDRRELLWALVACATSIMAIFMTTPLMIHRLYYLLFGLGLALASMSDAAFRIESLRLRGARG